MQNQPSGTSDLGSRSLNVGVYQVDFIDKRLHPTSCMLGRYSQHGQHMASTNTTLSLPTCQDAFANGRPLGGSMILIETDILLIRFFGSSIQQYNDDAIELHLLQ